MIPKLKINKMKYPSIKIWLWTLFLSVMEVLENVILLAILGLFRGNFVFPLVSWETMQKMQ